MEKPVAFVIMAAGPEQRGVYGLIKRTLEEIGWSCQHISEQYGAGNIVRGVIQGIADATLVLVDLTNLDRDALYELGVAHALSNHVLTLFSGDEQSLPLDLRAYRYTRYENSFEGADKLKHAIIHAIQALPEWGKKPSNPVWDFLPPERRSSRGFDTTPSSEAILDDELLREIGYRKELATATRQRLHYIELQQLRAPNEALEAEATQLRQRLHELREHILRLEERAR